MTEQKEATICIPVFNARNNIERCLKAALGQNVPGLRMMVVDNASNDGTNELAAEVLKDVDRANVYRNPRNLGRIENWNRCIQLCQTKYLKFALVNDVLLPGSLACLMNSAEQADDTAMVCSWFKDVENVPTTLPEVKKHPTVLVRSPTETAEFFATNGFRTGGLNGMLFNREFIEQRNLRFREDIPYCADYLFGIELAAMGSTVFVDAETYLFHSGNTARFHYVGLKDPGSFFREQKECALALSAQIGEPATAFQYLEGQYRWFLSQGMQLKIADVLAAFTGAPLKTRVKATWLTVRVNLSRMLGRTKPGVKTV